MAMTRSTIRQAGSIKVQLVTYPSDGMVPDVRKRATLKLLVVSSNGSTKRVGSWSGSYFSMSAKGRRILDQAEGKAPYSQELKYLIKIQKL